MFNKFPKTRPALPSDIAKIYKAYYKQNRQGRTPASCVSQWAESWLHRQVARDVITDPASKTTLEIGAGTLNQLRFEPERGPYDIVEPFEELHAEATELRRIRSFYRDMNEIGMEWRYDRITSIATFEHICNLPEVIAKTGLLLEEDGTLRVSIPSEGRLLWRIGSELTTGIEFRLRFGLDFSALRRHEHVNTAREIEDLLRYFYGEVQRKVLGITRAISLYQFYACKHPDRARCSFYLENCCQEGKKVDYK